MRQKYVRHIESKTVLERQEKVKYIKQLLGEGKTQIEVAAILGVSKQNINQQLNRPKYLARTQLRRAVKDGLITKTLLCIKCQKTPPTSAHHEDYELPLEVLWLCEPCHVEIDRKGWKSRVYMNQNYL